MAVTSDLAAESNMSATSTAAFATERESANVPVDRFLSIAAICSDDGAASFSGLAVVDRYLFSSLVNR